MVEFILELKSRNELLFYFGVANLVLVGFFMILSLITDIQVVGVNAWYKPIKFALSIGIYTWTMGWFMHYLPQNKDIIICNWLIVIMLGFEIIYIGLQAGRGQLSHYNISSPLYSNLSIDLVTASYHCSSLKYLIGNLLRLEIFLIPPCCSPCNK